MRKSKELMFLLHILFDGEIILPVPSWVSYAPQAKLAGHHIIKLNTSYEDRWRNHRRFERYNLR